MREKTSAKQGGAKPSAAESGQPQPDNASPSPRAEATRGTELTPGESARKRPESNSAAQARSRASSVKPTRKRAAKPHTEALLTPAIVGIGVALGCTLAWQLMAFQSMNMYKGLPSYEQVLDQSYLLSIIATTITLALCGVFHKQFDRLLGSVLARYLFPAGIAVSTLLILGAALDSTTGPLGTAFVTAYGIGTGVFSALFLMNFGAVLGMLSLKQSAVSIAIGYLSSTLLFFVFLFFGRLEATMLCASMGPVAAAFLYYGVSSLHMDKKQANALPRQTDPDDPAEQRQLHSLMGAFGLTMLVCGVSYELSRTLYVQMGQFAASDVGPYAIAQGGVTTLTVVGTIAIALVLITKPGIRGPETCYRLIVVFLLVGALLLPAPLLFEGIPPMVPMAIDVAAFQCLGMGMWILLSGLCRRFQTQCLFAFGIIRAAWSAGPLVGMLVGRWLWYGVGLDARGAFTAACVCVLLVVVVNNFIFTESSLAAALSIMPTDRKQRFQDRCRAVIERYGLTEREGQVMVLFAKGRNLSYVQEELCLSKSTVSTHRQHIYQKLGVHSAQEMIDLIQEEKG